MRMIHAYQAPGNIPSRQEMLEAQYPDDYQLPQTTGWLSFRSLVKQCGIDYDEQIRLAQEAMARAMDDSDL